MASVIGAGLVFDFHGRVGDAEFFQQPRLYRRGDGIGRAGLVGAGMLRHHRPGIVDRPRVDVVDIGHRGDLSLQIGADLVGVDPVRCALEQDMGRGLDQGPGASDDD